MVALFFKNVLYYVKRKKKAFSRKKKTLIIHRTVQTKHMFFQVMASDLKY